MPTYELARQLPGLDSAWNFHLDVKSRKPGENTAKPDGPTIFDGFEQLGLKLERRKLPRPVLVTGYKEPLSNN